MREEHGGNIGRHETSKRTGGCNEKTIHGAELFLDSFPVTPNRSLAYALVKPHPNDRCPEGIPATRITPLGRVEPLADAAVVHWRISLLPVATIRSTDLEIL